MRLFTRLFVALVAVIGGVFLLLSQDPARVAAELDITPTPSITPTLFASEWSFLPHIQGVVAGPTGVPTFEPPTATPSPTTTSTPEATSTPTNTATIEPSPSPTATLTATVPPADTPTPTKTPKPNKTPTPTQEPQPTVTSAPGNTGDIRITKIFYDGEVFRYESDEYVEIKNVDTKPIKLKGWKLHDHGPNYTYTFPAYVIAPGQICRIYTNEDHPDSCGLNWKNNHAIWNNEEVDEATLFDSTGKTIDSCSYTPKTGEDTADC